MGIQRIRLDQVRSNTVDYNDFSEQLIGMSQPFYEEFLATEGQTDFVISKNYMMGNNSLKVFVNGIYQDLGSNASYVEVNQNLIRFNEALYADDWVMVRIEGAGGGTTLSNHIHHVRENLTGDIDGVNRVFELAYVPREGTEHLYKNGMLMHDGEDEDYTIDGRIITFVEAPLTGAKLLITYIT